MSDADGPGDERRPAPGAGPEARRRRALFLAFAALATALCLALRPDRAPLTSDNQFQFFAAERAASGVPPYRSQMTPKTAATFLLSGAAIRCGRALGIPDLMAARALSIGLFAAAVGLAVLIGLELTGSAWLASLGGLALLTFGGLVYQAVMGCRPKVFIVAFVLLALWTVARRRTATNGLAGSLAAMTWQPGVLVAVPAAAALALAPREPRARWRALGRIALATLAASLLYEGYFWRHDMLREQLYCSVYVPLFLMPRGGETLAQIGSELLGDWPLAFGALHPATLTYLAMIPLGAWAALRALRGRGERARDRALMLALAASGFLTAAFTAYEHQGYPDLLLLAPFVALSLPIAVDALTRSASARARRAAAGVAGALVLALGLPPTLSYAPHKAPRYDLQDQVRLAGEVGELAGPDGTIYAHGCAHLLAFLHRDNWSPWGLLFRGWRAIAAHDPLAAPTLLHPGGHPMPDVVLNDRSARFQPLLQGTYERRRLPEFHRQGIEVWVRTSR